MLRVSPVVDNSTGTVKVTVSMQPPGRLFKPGAFVRVDIETDSREKTTLIPKRALVQQDGQTFVFVADGAQAKRREVKLGYESGGRWRSSKGSPRGERRRRRPRQSQRRLEDQGSAGRRRSAEFSKSEFHRGCNLKDADPQADFCVDGRLGAAWTLHPALGLP